MEYHGGNGDGEVGMGICECVGVRDDGWREGPTLGVGDLVQQILDVRVDPLQLYAEHRHQDSVISVG